MDEKPTNREGLKELERLTAKLNESHHELGELYRILFKESPAAQVLINSSGYFATVNSAYCRLTGYTEGELERMRYYEITHPEDIGQSIKLDREMSEGKIDVYRMLKRHVHKNGAIVESQLTVKAVRDTEGNLLYGIGVLEPVIITS